MGGLLRAVPHRVLGERELERLPELGEGRDARVAFGRAARRVVAQAEVRDRHQAEVERRADNDGDGGDDDRYDGDGDDVDDEDDGAAAPDDDEDDAKSDYGGANCSKHVSQTLSSMQTPLKTKPPIIVPGRVDQ